MGKPVIAGTRITVELILEKLAAGETVEQVLEGLRRIRGSTKTRFGQRLRSRLMPSAPRMALRSHCYPAFSFVLRLR